MSLKRHRDRKGAVLIAVLVCMGVATAIVLCMVKTSVIQRRQLRYDLQMEQTKWMLDAGVRKAISNLEKKADFEGGTIVFSPTVSRFESAAIEIEIKRNDKDASSLRLKVTAEIRGKNENSMVTKRSQELVLEVQD